LLLLGVECEFCPVAHANEKDDKNPKVTARKMIEMMMAINKDNFEGHREVTCYSCHRGSTDPAATPIITDDEPRAAGGEEKKPGETKASLPPADQLLDKYLAAIGGAVALQKITSRVQKGTLTAFGGQHFSVDVYSKAPDKRVSIMHLQGGDSITAFDGKQGWLGVPGRMHTMSTAENDAARIDADLYLPAHLKTLYQKFSVDAGEKIDGHDTYMVVGRTEGQPPLRLYLDKESSLLLRLVRYAETPLGRNPTQIDYADYRDANGVKVPSAGTWRALATDSSSRSSRLNKTFPWTRPSSRRHQSHLNRLLLRPYFVKATTNFYSDGRPQPASLPCNSMSKGLAVRLCCAPVVPSRVSSYCQGSGSDS